jgi:hypothetical protein
VTLAKGMDQGDFETFADTETMAIHRASGGDAAQRADVLQEVLPRANGIAPVLPDLIGEALVRAGSARQTLRLRLGRCCAATPDSAVRWPSR